MSAYYRNRLLLLLATVVACAVIYLVGRWARVPYESDFDASLWAMPGAAARLLAVIAALAAGTAVATLIAGAVRVEAGLFAAAVGLATLSVRGGPMRYVLQREDLGNRLYGGLVIELLVLGLAIGALWATLTTLAGRRVPLADPSPLDGPVHARRGRRKLQAGAFVLHVLVTGAAALFLLASDDKKQAVIGLGVASFIGGMVASWIGPVPMGAWLWAGPVVVGVVGYGSAWVGGTTSAVDAGLLAPLLRAAPLDYAGAGVSGAILGRWLGVSREQSTDLALTGTVPTLVHPE